MLASRLDQIVELFVLLGVVTAATAPYYNGSSSAIAFWSFTTSVTPQRISQNLGPSGQPSILTGSKVSRVASASPISQSSLGASTSVFFPFSVSSTAASASAIASFVGHSNAASSSTISSTVSQSAVPSTKVSSTAVFVTVGSFTQVASRTRSALNSLPTAAQASSQSQLSRVSSPAVRSSRAPSSIQGSYQAVNLNTKIAVSQYNSDVSIQAQPTYAPSFSVFASSKMVATSRGPSSVGSVITTSLTSFRESRPGHSVSISTLTPSSIGRQSLSSLLSSNHQSSEPRGSSNVLSTKPATRRSAAMTSLSAASHQPLSLAHSVRSHGEHTELDPSSIASNTSRTWTQATATRNSLIVSGPPNSIQSFPTKSALPSVYASVPTEILSRSSRFTTVASPSILDSFQSSLVGVSKQLASSTVRQLSLPSAHLSASAKISPYQTPSADARASRNSKRFASLFSSNPSRSWSALNRPALPSASTPASSQISLSSLRHSEASTLLSSPPEHSDFGTQGRDSSHSRTRATSTTDKLILQPRETTIGSQYLHESAPILSVVTAYTTYCASPTSFAYGSQTINVSKASTVTITDCPCTLTRESSEAPWSLIPRTASKSSKFALLPTSTGNAEPSPAITSSENLTTTISFTKAVIVTRKATAPSLLSAETVPGTPSTPSYKPKLTTTVSALTTFCSTPTTFALNSRTFELSTPATLTLSDCVLTRAASSNAPWSLVEDTTSARETTPASEYGKSSSRNHVQSTTNERRSFFTTAYTSPTTVTFNSKVYSITGPTTLTVTACPSTMTSSSSRYSSSEDTGTQSSGVISETFQFKGSTSQGTVALTHPYSFASTSSSTSSASSIAGTIPRSSAQTELESRVTPATTLSTTFLQSLTTTVVSSFTTFCPTATTFTVNSKTYTAFGPTTFTVTDCPCTLTNSPQAPKGLSTIAATPRTIGKPVQSSGVESFVAQSPKTVVTGAPHKVTGLATTSKSYLSLLETTATSSTSDAQVQPKSTRSVRASSEAMNIGSITGGGTVVTVSTVYTTFCPSATTFTVDSSTYTATGATTFTITGSTTALVSASRSEYSLSNVGLTSAKILHSSDLSSVPSTYGSPAATSSISTESATHTEVSAATRDSFTASVPSRHSSGLPSPYDTATTHVDALSTDTTPATVSSTDSITTIARVTRVTTLTRHRSSLLEAPSSGVVGVNFNGGAGRSTTTTVSGGNVVGSSSPSVPLSNKGHVLSASCVLAVVPFALGYLA